ncbi:hypothetical protein ACFWOB_42705 [Streptomyces sp. NPDC058420]|uniref:hypothetical protein n=1 Tax=Streptomyces sp. NPDC058420 TaxID=3346489 RepID=UPI003669352C
MFTMVPFLVLSGGPSGRNPGGPPCFSGGGAVRRGLVMLTFEAPQDEFDLGGQTAGRAVGIAATPCAVEQAACLREGLFSRDNRGGRVHVAARTVGFSN